MASQLVKVWLPTIMSRFGRSGGSGGAFVLMWGVEAVGIISMALMFGGQTTSKKEPVSTALEGQLRVCCLSFFLACNCVMAILEVENLSVIGVLGGVHLVSQDRHVFMSMPHMRRIHDHVKPRGGCVQLSFPLRVLYLRACSAWSTGRRASLGIASGLLRGAVGGIRDSPGHFMAMAVRT